MPVGKRSECFNRANELVLDFANETGGTISLILRAYDDGVAYRYRIHGTGQDTVLNEDSSFHVPAGSQGWFARYTQPHYEWYYDAHTHLTGIDYEVAVPALFHTPQGHWVYVTEAAVDGTYAGVRLRFREAKGEILAFHLPEQPSSTLPWLTPWRVAIIGKELATLVESTLVAQPQSTQRNRRHQLDQAGRRCHSLDDRAEHQQHELREDEAVCGSRQRNGLDLDRIR